MLSETKKRKLFARYEQIMHEEAVLGQHCNWTIPDPEIMYRNTCQIIEIAKSSTVLRSYVKTYGIAPELSVAPESVAAHTNLMSAIVDRALVYLYGTEIDMTFTKDHYSYRMIMEAIRRHDLPENETGDIPDNGSRNEANKRLTELNFQRKFSDISCPRGTRLKVRTFELKVTDLLREMEEKSSLTGRLLFAADKASALIATLCTDATDHPATRPLSDPTLSSRDREEINLCDRANGDGRFFASEMWAIDYFKLRKLVDYDDHGFITGLIVMYTLLQNNHWYAWRTKEYL